MSQSLVSSLTDMMNAADTRRIAEAAGTPEEHIRRGYRTAVLSILAGIAAKVHEPAELRRLFDAVASPEGECTDLSVDFPEYGWQGVTGIPSIEKGQVLLSMLFGDSQSMVVAQAGKRASLPSGVMVQLMSLAAPMVLSAVGRRNHDRGISLRSLPDPGGGKPREPVMSLSASPLTVTGEPPRRRWTSIVLVAGVLLGVGWLRGRATSGDKVKAAEAASVATRWATIWPGVGTPVQRNLPASVPLRVPDNGMEVRLISYIEDSSRHAGAGTENQFDFDRIAFDKDSALPRPESEEQLGNVASILRAYPSVRLDIEAYTPAQGDRNASLRLAKNRAEAVKRELVGMGISASRLEVQGHGDQHGAANIATEHGRENNDRISLKGLQK